MLPAVKNAQGAALLLLASLCFSAMWIFSKLLHAHHDMAQIIFMRYVAVVLFTLPFMLRLPRPFAVPRAAWRWIGMRGCLQALSISLSFWAIANMPMMEATALVFSQPLFALPVAWWLLREKITRTGLVWNMIGFMGVLILVGASSAMFQWVAVAAVTAAIISSFAVTSVRRAAEFLHPLQITVFAECLAGALMLVPAMHYWQPLQMGDAGLWLGFMLVACIGNISFIRAFSVAEVSAIMPIQYIQVALVGVADWVLFGQYAGVSGFVGTLIIVCSTMMVVRQANKK